MATINFSQDAERERNRLKRAMERLDLSQSEIARRVARLAIDRGVKAKPERIANAVQSSISNFLNAREKHGSLRKYGPLILEVLGEPENVTLAPIGQPKKLLQSEIEPVKDTHTPAFVSGKFKVYQSVDAAEGFLYMSASANVTSYGPPRLLGVPGAFGFVMCGDGMRGIYHPGDTLWCDPTADLELGRNVIAFHHKVDHKCIVGTLMFFDAVEFILHQSIGKKTLKRKEFPRVIRIIGHTDAGF